jgi:ATP-dependent DNA helicase RecQ
MERTPLESLRSVFGYESFRPGQQEIIEGLISGRDAFVLMPTGGGKSLLSFRYPPCTGTGVGIVVSRLSR